MSASITDKDLINLVFNNRPVPRVPVGFWFHFLDESRQGSGDGSFFSENVAGHRRFINSFQPDMVKIMSDGFFYYPLHKPADNPVEMLDKLADVTAGHPWVRDQVRLIEAVRALKDDTSYFYNIFSPSTTLRFMVGRQTFLDWFSSFPDATFRLLREMGRGIRILAAEAVAHGGADGVFFSVQNPDLQIFTDDDYRSFLLEDEVALLNDAKKAGGRNILHICGYDGVRNRLEFFGDYPADAFSWAVNIENVSLGEGRKIFQGKPVIGGFPNTAGSILHTGTKAEIEEFTEKILLEAGRVGVIVGADCTVPTDIELERLRWVRTAANSVK
ncbi:MAG: uroporphyrinogen decarboxylase [Deltaproteobacteria bacterium]|nr:uroporphyrinogen decarboxylase [Deltaproteobacteria bacterium]